MEFKRFVSSSSVGSGDALTFFPSEPKSQLVVTDIVVKSDIADDVSIMSAMQDVVAPNLQPRKLSAAALAGANTIVLDSVADLVPTDSIVVQGDNVYACQPALISNIVGLTVTLNSNLYSNFAAGSRVIKLDREDQLPTKTVSTNGGEWHGECLFASFRGSPVLVTAEGSGAPGACSISVGGYWNDQPSGGVV